MVIRALSARGRATTRRPIESLTMPQTFITTIELRNMSAITAVARAFKYNVIHQTPQVDAILKRHAIMILSGYHRAAQRQKGSPTRDAAFVDLVCDLLFNAANGKDDANKKVLRKLFRISTSDQMQIARLVRTCTPESMVHKDTPQPAHVMNWRQDDEEHVVNPRKPREKRLKSADELDASMNLISAQNPANGDDEEEDIDDPWQGYKPEKF